MVTSHGVGSFSPLGAAKQVVPSHDRDVYAHHTQNPNYDSVSISHAPTGESRFQKEVVSRLSQEIRTSTTIRDIQALRQEVASGNYKPDPAAIAARILFLGEEV